MPNNDKWVMPVAALAALLMNTACAEQKAVAADKPTATERLAADARTAIATINKNEVEGVAFEKDTVIRLNAIVKRTVDALDQFDRLYPEFALARQSGDAARVAAIATQFAALEQQTIAARAEFLAEKEALIARGEEHNAIMLATMEQFVVEAPEEIASAIARQPG